MVSDWGGRPIVVFPPVTREIRKLEQQLIGNAFDESVQAVIQPRNIELLDLRGVQDYEFEDVNHLSKRGAYDLSRAYFLPALEKALPH